jgi:hypothetical protein
MPYPATFFPFGFPHSSPVGTRACRVTGRMSRQCQRDEPQQPTVDHSAQHLGPDSLSSAISKALPWFQCFIGLPVIVLLIVGAAAAGQSGPGCRVAGAENVSWSGMSSAVRCRT